MNHIDDDILGTSKEARKIVRNAKIFDYNNRLMNKQLNNHKNYEAYETNAQYSYINKTMVHTIYSSTSSVSVSIIK